MFAAAQQARRQRLQHDTLVDRESQAEQSICDHCGQEGCEQQRSEDAIGNICCCFFSRVGRLPFPWIAWEEAGAVHRHQEIQSGRMNGKKVWMP